MNKKAKIIFITILCIVLLASVAGVIWWYVKKWEDSKEFNTPEEVTKAYLEYIDNNQFGEIYNLLTEESKQNFSKENLENAYKVFYEELNVESVKNSDVQYEKIDTFYSKATYTSTLCTIYGDIEIQNSINFKKQDDKKYYINWDYNYIYPNYSADDVIKINKVDAKRGNISDRNGVLLAGTGYIKSVGLVPGWMNEETKTQDIQTVSELLGISVDTINKKMSASYVKSDTFVELDKISNQKLTIIDGLTQIKGVKLKNIEARVYPYGKEAAHLTGYVQRASSEDIEKNKEYDENTLVGKAGLELAYNERLSGKNGYEITLEDKDGNSKATILKTEKVDGENIRLTIDAKLQTKVYNMYVTDCSATVVMNPKNGEILALVSTPSYDANDFLLGLSTQEWNDLNNNSNTPMVSRFLKRYAPGSSFKPLIGAIALKTGTITNADEYETSGTSWQKDSSWGSYYITTLKTYQGANLANALIYSDNIFFAKTALKIGKEKLEEALKEFGFEDEFSFDMKLTNSQISNEGKFISEVQLADSGYGQGQVLINPLHYAAMYSAFVNDGNMVMPKLELKDGEEVTYYKEAAFSKEIADEIRTDLIQTIENPEGTATAAKIDGVTLAGKTGTAETKTAKQEDAKEIGWFNAFIADPNSEKQYLVISMVENVENKGGSIYVVKQVRQIFEELLK